VHADAKGDKAVAYDKLVPVLIEAVKEQQTALKEKNARIERLEKTLERMERRMITLESLPQTLALK
jgi:DNA mismatch repair ATPase MutL